MHSFTFLSVIGAAYFNTCDAGKAWVRLTPFKCSDTGAATGFVAAPNRVAETHNAPANACYTYHPYEGSFQHSKVQTIFCSYPILRGVLVFFCCLIMPNG